MDINRHTIPMAWVYRCNGAVFHHLPTLADIPLLVAAQTTTTKDPDELIDLLYLHPQSHVVALYYNCEIDEDYTEAQVWTHGACGWAKLASGEQAWVLCNHHQDGEGIPWFEILDEVTHWNISSQGRACEQSAIHQWKPRVEQIIKESRVIRNAKMKLYNIVRGCCAGEQGPSYHESASNAILYCKHGKRYHLRARRGEIVWMISNKTNVYKDFITKLT